MAKYDLIWLASYPKSGNTWLRCFFSALFSRNKFDINDIGFDEIFADEYLFSQLVKKNIADYPQRQLEEERRKVLDFYIQTKPSPYLLKIHDKYQLSLYDNLPIFHVNRPTAAIYIVRNPLDVALSFSRYLNLSIDDIIDRYICKPKATIYMSNRFPRQIGTWQEHVLSWKNQTSIPVLFIRYEDLRLNPFENFKKIVSFLGLDFSEAAIQHAIQQTEFHTLQKLEQNNGFKERLVPNVPFFHSGNVREGEIKLNSHQIQQVIDSNKYTMEWLKYFPLT